MAKENERCDALPPLLIAIGASAGGFNEIVYLVERFPPWVEATLLIATHREPGTKNLLAKLLANRARVRVDEPEDEDCLERTTIYVGKAEEKVEVEDSEFDVEYDISSYARIHRIDDLFKSVAESAGKNSVGVILSGMLYDGVEGLKAIEEAGGKCIIQHPEDAQYSSMPESALKAVTADFVGTTEEIASIIMELATGRGV